MNVYFFPPRVPMDRAIDSNPYTNNFMQSLGEKVHVMNKDTYANIAIVDLLKYLFKMDTIILNWIENIEHRKFGKLQFLVFKLAFKILQLRNVQTVWVFHNMHPHQGETTISRHLYSSLFRTSDLIVTHSKKAEFYIKERTKAKVLFKHHPNHCDLVEEVEPVSKNMNKAIKYDILIWGAIEPYKGILEFMSFLKSTPAFYDLKIKIIGRCSNKTYVNKIASFVGSNVEFEDRSASFYELKKLIQLSKFVVFPYQSNSVSSSGALFDTLCFEGNCVGPNTGSFSDLAKENLCHVFESYDELLEIILNKESIDKKEIRQFVQSNTWAKFSEELILGLQNK